MAKTDKKRHHPLTKFSKLPKQQEDFIRGFYIDELTKNPYRTMRSIYDKTTAMLRSAFDNGSITSGIHKGKICKCCSIPSYEWFSNSRSQKSLWGMWSTFNHWYEKPFSRSFISSSSIPTKDDPQKDFKIKVATTIESKLDVVRLAMQELRADGKTVSVRLAYNIAIQCKMFPIVNHDTIWEIINSALAYTEEELVHERFTEQKGRGAFDTHELDEFNMMYPHYDSLVSHSEDENHKDILKQIDFYNGSTDYDLDVKQPHNLTWQGLNDHFKNKYYQDNQTPTHFNFMISIVGMELNRQSKEFEEAYHHDGDMEGWKKSVEVLEEVRAYIDRVNRILDSKDRILFKSTLTAVLKYLKEKEMLDFYPQHSKWTSMYSTVTFVAKWDEDEFERLVEMVMEVTKILDEKPSTLRNGKLIDLLKIPHKMIPIDDC